VTPERRRLAAVFVVLLSLGGLVVACSSGDERSSDATQRSRPSRGTVRPRPTQARTERSFQSPDPNSPLGTATIVQLDPRRYDKPQAGFCEAIREFDARYGPFTKPTFPARELPEVVPYFRRLHDAGPEEVKRRLGPVLALADQAVQAQQRGELAPTDEALAFWVQATIGAERSQQLFAELATVIMYATLVCEVQLPGK
jgi:hypothetical protein